MLDFSSGHLLILLVVALVVLGPGELPKFLRMIGQAVGKMRRMADQFKNSFDEMARQSELDELRKELAELRDERLSGHASTEPPEHFAEQEPPAEPILPEGATPAEPLAVPLVHDPVTPPSDAPDVKP